MGQTKGQLRNTEGLAKDKWQKGLVYTVSMAGAFLPKEHAEAWEWKEVEWSFGIGTGLEVGRVEAVRDQGRGSCMCGERVLVLSDLVFQDAWGPREARRAAGRSRPLVNKNRAFALFGQFTYKDLIYMIE